MNRLLVPVDFSEASANTLKYAHQLAIDKGVELDLLYCFPLQEYSRKYNFPGIDYAKGIRTMLKAFYQEHIEDQKGFPKFIGLQGSVVENIVQLSLDYKAVVLSFKIFSSAINRWLGSRSIAVASLAYCPVIMVPPNASFTPWDNIWHVKRKDSEAQIIEQGIKKVNISLSNITTKYLEQSTFTSLIWKSMVMFMKKKEEKFRQQIIEAEPGKEINLIMLVSHQKGSFQQFVNNDAIHILFEFGIPLIIFQAKSSDLN